MPTLDLNAWIRDNQRLLKPPVSNKQLLSDSKDAIVFVSGGPNTRNDFHVNPTEEIFYQLKGDIAVRVRPLDGTPPRDVVIKEGDLFLLPRFVPHRPQRPAGTLGLVIEFPRGADAEGKPQMDGLRWYCPTCDTLVHEASWVLKKIDEDLKIIMEEFWNGPIERRSCRRCGHVIQRAGAIELKDGFVKSAGAKPKPATPKPATPKPAETADLSKPEATKTEAVSKPEPKAVAKPAPTAAEVDEVLEVDEDEEDEMGADSDSSSESDEEVDELLDNGSDENSDGFIDEGLGGDFEDDLFGDDDDFDDFEDDGLDLDFEDF